MLLNRSLLLDVPVFLHKAVCMNDKSSEAKFALFSNMVTNGSSASKIVHKAVKEMNPYCSSGDFK